jgi:hypothetical protein
VVAMRILTAVLKAFGVFVGIALVLWSVSFILEHYGPLWLYGGMILMIIFTCLTASFLYNDEEKEKK